jgi:2-isopropylmalate synthase
MNYDLEIYDTTLRDGSQGEGINFSVQDKLRLAERLDGFGIQYIEGGWPGSNPRDLEFFELARRRKWKNSRLAAFGSTRRKNVPVAEDDQVALLLAAETPVVTIFGKTWLLHVKEVLRATPDENVRMITDTIRYLKAQGKYVIYDAEHSIDGFKDCPDYALATWQAAAEAGADNITLCDTNGGSLPGEVAEATARLRAKVRAAIGIHTHNDIGLGVANALAGVGAGAVLVQGTMNGYGERTGNCNLITTIPNLAVKLKKNCLPAASLAKLRDLSLFVDETANLRHDPRQPWVGETAFAHKGGMHVNAVQKVSRSFEHVDPSLVGNYRRVLVSDMSGRSNIVMKAQELGFQISNDTPELKMILNEIKDLEHKGYEFEAAEGSLIVLMRRCLTQVKPKFDLEAYHVSMRRASGHSICEATVKILVDGRRAHTVAEGDGPVNALDSALRAALSQFYPKLAHVQLIDYKVRILDGAEGTAARTRVLIVTGDGKKEWGTVGVSANIIEASLQALSDSMEYCLMNHS